MHWVKAIDAANDTEVWINVDRARTIVGTREGVIVQFDDADAVTVRGEPETLIGSPAQRRT